MNHPIPSVSRLRRRPSINKIASPACQHISGHHVSEMSHISGDGVR